MKKILIESEDLVFAMDKAKKENNDILNDLMDAFLDMDNSVDGNELEVNNKLADYIKAAKIDSIITADSLAIALSRSIYEYNHEMTKKLKKYFRNYIDSLVKKEDISVVVNLIIDDEGVMDYVNKYNSTDEYIDYLIKKRIDKKEDIKKEETKKTSKSYVIM